MFRRHLFGHQILDPHDQDVFVVRSIEDRDHSFSGSTLVDPPEEVMGLFFLAGHLERIGAAALWIHSSQHLTDQTIFAGRVGSLRFSVAGDDDTPLRLTLEPEPDTPR